MHALELKIPPLLIVLAAAALMWVAAWSVPAFGFDIPYRRLCGGALAVTGAIAAMLGVVSFRQARTTVNPMNPGSASSLVVSGIYKRTRNPMYLGFLLVLAGWAVFLANALAFLVLPLFMLYMNRFQIQPEEAALTSRFGNDFVAYKSRVRRWL
jgi:protein-S-isoprenylcysteine O-methyltransferase Ste14